MLYVVVGGQFGSEGKGAVVGKLTSQFTHNDTCVRVGGPNAGHTVYDSEGRKWALRQVPAAAPVSDCKLFIGAGSEVDLPVLYDEIERLEAAGHAVTERLYVHPSATRLVGKHKTAEQLTGMRSRLGSTAKGIGAARADRIMRTADIIGRQDRSYPFIVDDDPGGICSSTNDEHDVLIEGTQGYGLGLHTDFYPMCTSSDCRAIDFMSMAGINPYGRDLRIVLVVRPNPIRVAGNSGPLLGETTWEDLGLSPEHTTVTNLIRRVGQWDPDLVKEAVDANGGHPYVTLALTMMDHIFPQIAGVTTAHELYQRGGDEVVFHYTDIAGQVGADVSLVGTGPKTMVTL